MSNEQAERLGELRALYEPFLQGLSNYFCLRSAAILPGSASAGQLADQRLDRATRRASPSSADGRRCRFKPLWIAASVRGMVWEASANGAICREHCTPSGG